MRCHAAVAIVGPRPCVYWAYDQGAMHLNREGWRRVLQILEVTAFIDVLLGVLRLVFSPMADWRR